MYDAKTIEEDVLKFWEQNKTFDKLRKRNKGKEKFNFLDGPITANAPMGVHHAYARSLKDLYQRYKAMNGYDERYQNGFDCHGLPVEVEVEKELGIKTKKEIEKYGIDNFIKKCRERVEKMSAVQTRQSIRLGQWMDWGNDYYTMSDENIETIWAFLKKCEEKEMLYKGNRVVPWCWRCGTSLSQHELVDGYKELTHDAVFLQFKIKGKKNEYLLVWTTTPWTLSSNVACAVNPDVVYVKAEKDGKIYYLSKALAEKVLGKYKELDVISGSQMINWEYEGPYDNLPAQKNVVHKVVDWELVGETDGTGIVHIAPGCGAEDFELGEQLELAKICPIDENGDFTKGFGFLTGKNVSNVKEDVIKDLKERGVLFKMDKITHRYPMCWRCNTELVFMMTDSWFLKADTIRDYLLDLNKGIYWYPEFGGKIMNDWLANLRDWNFSRRRYWGAPLPFWMCEKCSHTNVISSREELEKRATYGLEQLRDLHRPNIDRVLVKCEKCGGNAKRVEEVADAWIDSGIVPYSTMHYLTDYDYWKEWFPAQAISEMREQIRLWFYSMLFISAVMERKAPYKKVFLFEKVYDEKGEEMHKTGKNVIWFDDAVEKIGADVMRWMYAKTTPTQNVLFGYNAGKENNNKLSYFVNVATYAEKFLEKPEKLKDLKPEDEWLASRLESTKKNVTEFMEKLEIHLAAREIESFVENDLSKDYIKFTRSRMKTSEKNKVATIIYNSLLDSMRMAAPFTPFITEHLYQKHFRKYEKEESIHLKEWPKADEKLIDKKLEEKMSNVRAVIESAMAARNAAGINVRQPLASLTIEAKGLETWHDLIAEQVNVKSIKIGKTLALDTKMTPALEKEGLTREVVRRVQQMRKDMSLVETDKIALVITPKLDIDYDELKKTANVAQMPASLEGKPTQVVIKGKNVTITAKKL